MIFLSRPTNYYLPSYAIFGCVIIRVVAYSYYKPSRRTTRTLVAVMAAQADDSITSFFQKVLGNYGYGDSMDADSDDDDEGTESESETAKSTATTDGLFAKGASQDISKSFGFGLKPFRIVSRTRFQPSHGVPPLA